MNLYSFENFKQELFESAEVFGSRVDPESMWYLAHGDLSWLLILTPEGGRKAYQMTMTYAKSDWINGDPHLLLKAAIFPFRRIARKDNLELKLKYPGNNNSLTDHLFDSFLDQDVVARSICEQNREEMTLRNRRHDFEIYFKSIKSGIEKYDRFEEVIEAIGVTDPNFTTNTRNRIQGR